MEVWRILIDMMVAGTEDPVDREVCRTLLWVSILWVQRRQIPPADRMFFLTRLSEAANDGIAARKVTHADVMRSDPRFLNIPAEYEEFLLTWADNPPKDASGHPYIAMA